MKNSLLSLKISLAVFALLSTLTIPMVYADDTEVYGNANSPPVNVMFIFDMSSSMLRKPVDDGTIPPEGSGESRKEILQQALTNVLQQNKDKDYLHVGYSWFYDRRSGIKFPASSISADLKDVDTVSAGIPDDTYFVHSQFSRQLAEIPVDPSVWETGIVGAIRETQRYYRGELATGHFDAPPAWDPGTGLYDSPFAPNPLSYTPDPGPLAWGPDGNEYDFDCGYNLTNCYEGYTNGILRYNVRNCRITTFTDICKTYGLEGACIEYFPPFDYHHCDYSYQTNAWLGARYNSPITQQCQQNFIVLLSDGEPTHPGATYDIENYIINKSCADLGAGLEDGKCGPELVEYMANNDQSTTYSNTSVVTYTIGFAINGQGKDYLKLLAEKGNGKFFPANDATELEEAFADIINELSAENESFTGLSTSVRGSSLSSDNRVFTNMFKPGPGQAWAGNTKGYFIDENGLIDINKNSAIEIVNGVDKFKSGAQSFWSSDPDGNSVASGGASGRLSSGRKILFYNDPADPDNESLTELVTGDTSIPFSLFNLADEVEKDALIDWLYNDAKYADPLHSRPVILDYDGQQVVYTMTNQGLLHAVDANKPLMDSDGNVTNAPLGGSELFAFIPRAMMPNIKFHEANINSNNHLYGLDGSISYFHEDSDNDGVINNSEKAYLYFGMRRGGNHYYALDVSDPSAPKLAWRIDGGSGNFAKLGQTWSRMSPAYVNWSSAKTPVLFFGGGYDPLQDGYTERNTDSIGNALFMVHAKTGVRLWTATDSDNSDMQYSIPSDITLIDTDHDTTADRLYVGDMGGQVWRFDQDGDDFNGYKLARVASDNNTDWNHRFYSPPSVAKMSDNTSAYYAVAIGSGFRAHPLSTDTLDRFYLFQDRDVDTGEPASTPGSIDANDLVDITTDVTPDMTGKKGWKLKFSESSSRTGEKNLSPALIFKKKLAFTTYEPPSASDACAAGGNGRFYLMNLNDGSPVKDFYDANTPSENLTATNRFKTVPGIGIPPAPINIYIDDKETTMVGKNTENSETQIFIPASWKAIE